MKKYNFLKYVFVIFVIALIIFAVYLNKKGNDENDVDDTSQAREEKNLTNITTLRVSAVNVDTINPITSNNQNIQDISKLIYEPMLSITEDYQIENCLAKEWINLSDTAYVVVLKEGIRWQNGGQLTANDVKFTIEQIQAIGGNSIYYSNVQHIANVEILSTYTIKITIDDKIPFFEYNLTFPIMSSQYYENDAIITSSKNNNAPGTGKYIIGNITSTEIELKKNNNWWGLSLGKNLSLETVLVKMYASAGEAYNAFKLGNLDLMTTQSLNYEEYIGTMGYKTVEYIGREYDYLAFNCSSTILKNEELRKAINYAIDKSNIVTSVYENKYYVADFPVSTSNYLYKVEKVSSSYNTNKSKELLEKNGWELVGGNWQKQNNGTAMKASLNLVVDANNLKRLAVAEEIEKQLAETGIIVNIIRANSSQYAKYLENKNYDMILTGKLIGISPDLTSYIGKENLSQFENAEANELLREISDLSDNESELLNKYKQLIRLIEEERPYVSLYFNRGTVIYTQDLQGRITPNFYNIFYNIEEWVRQY
ncbi:MAG: hypothetical protein HFJ19_00700 [Clostridia bacterium]|nr:hypothetical protein [Clostridia bacterium]